MRHDAREHAKYGGSSAARYFSCHASVKLAGVVPNVRRSRWSREGTAAHELLEDCLKNDCFDASLGSAIYGYDGEALGTPEKVQEAVDSVQTVLDYVAEIIATFPDAKLYFEHAFQIPSVDPDNTWGTNDILIHVPSLNWVYVIDFKHGEGIVVEVENNKQLLYYGTGAYYSDDIPGAQDCMYILVIIQPRAVHKRGPVRDWVVPAERLRDFLSEINHAITQCEQPNPTFHPSRENCQFCDGKPACPAAEAKALQVVKSTFATVKDVPREPLPDPRELSIERISWILDNKKALTDWLESIETFAFDYAMSGGTLFNRKLVETYGKRQWPKTKDEQYATAAALMRLVGTTDWDEVFPRKFITITDAEAKVKAKFRQDAPRGQKKFAAEEATKALAALTHKESSGTLTLVPITDPRPAVDRAQQTFASVTVLPPPQEG